MAEEPICRHCRKPIAYGPGWWEHVGGTVACNPHQATSPPRGTNAAPLAEAINAQAPETHAPPQAVDL